MRETATTRQRDASHDHDVTAVVFFLVTACSLDFLLYRTQSVPGIAPWFTSQALAFALLRRLGLKFWYLIFLGAFVNGYFIWFAAHSVPVVFVGILLTAAYSLAALFWFPRDRPDVPWMKKGLLFGLMAFLTTAVVARLSWTILNRNQLIQAIDPITWTWQLTLRDSLDFICTYPFLALNFIPAARRLVYGKVPEDEKGPGVLPAALMALLPLLAFAVPRFDWIDQIPLYLFIIPALAVTYRFGVHGASSVIFGIYFLLYDAWPYGSDDMVKAQVPFLFCLTIVCFALGKVLDQARFEQQIALERRDTQIKSLHRQLLQIEENRREWRSLTQTLERLVMRSTQDLRTPLTPIYIWSQMLREDDSRKSVEEASSAIQLHIERQTRMLEELRDSVRISMGHQLVRNESFEMAELLRELANTWKGEAKSRRIDFHYDRELAPCQVLGDREQLSLALQKLFEHLLQFGKDDAVISLHASTQHREVILHLKHSGYSSDQQHVLKLLQAGQGMDQESFLTAANFDLALYTARKLIDLQGGRLTAASLSPKPGMVFSLSLRRASARDNAEPAVRAPREAVRSPGTGLVPPLALHQRMLIVEDDPFTLHLLDTLLSSEGVETIPCANSLEAIDAFHRWQPSLVLADLGLPDINGFELMRRIKKASKQDFYAIAFSACVTPEAQQQALDAGFSAFLAKPLQAKDLWETLQNLGVQKIPFERDRERNSEGENYNASYGHHL